MSGADHDLALRFLRAWPSAFPHLVAIHIDNASGEKGLIEARAFTGGDLDNGAIAAWLAEREGKANCYFTCNSLRTPKDKKAAEADVAEVVAFWVDADLPPGVEQNTGMRDMLARVPSFRLAPTWVVASGGGIQLFWVLESGSRLAVNQNTNIDEIKARGKALEAEAKSVFCDLAKVDSVSNLDRIMRLPGTINLPDEGKRKKGRLPITATVASHTGRVYALSEFTSSTPLVVAATDVGKESKTPITTIDDPRLARVSGPDKAMILKPPGEEDYYQLSLAMRLINSGCSDHIITEIFKHFPVGADELEHKPGKIARLLRKAHAQITDARNVQRRAEATNAGVPLWRDCHDKAGLFPRPTMRNAVIAISALEIRCRRNNFKYRIEIDYRGETQVLKNLIGEHNDDVTDAVRSYIDQVWNIDLGDKNVLDGIRELARANCYNPVLDYLDTCEGQWDKVNRLDTWLIDYLGAADTALNRAISRCVLVASVRRARQPGCSYQLITVLEGEEGLGKSSVIKILYGDEYFSDQHILGLDDKQVMEHLEGRWGYECADLTGMSRAEVESVKAFASRTHDRGRRAYGRTTEDVARTCVLWGSTNDDTYLQSQTGNRRFLPVLVTKRIDLDRLRADRDLLWGEAALAERQWPIGVEVNIPEAVWPDARTEQEARRVRDPWEDIVAALPRYVTVKDAEGRQQIRIIYYHDSSLGDDKEQPSERVAAQTILEHVLRVPPGQQNTFMGRRLAMAMARAGWRRTPGGTLLVGQHKVRGYWRATTGSVADYALPAAGGNDDELPY
jgi:predicted P-loop ATPase